MAYKDIEQHREKINLKARENYKANKDKYRAENSRRYHEKYKGISSTEERKAYMVEYRAKRKSEGFKYVLNEDQKQSCRDAAAKWQRENPDRVRLKLTLRKKKVKQATPTWVTKETLLPYYTAATNLEKVTGAKYHVDHIIPFVHDKVCGLNVPWNLQVIPASDNIKKSNSFEPYSIEH